MSSFAVIMSLFTDPPSSRKTRVLTPDFGNNTRITKQSVIAPHSPDHIIDPILTQVAVSLMQGDFAALPEVMVCNPFSLALRAWASIMISFQTLAT
jgi:hypothetical protein